MDEKKIKLLKSSGNRKRKVRHWNQIILLILALAMSFLGNLMPEDLTDRIQTFVSCYIGIDFLLFWIILALVLAGLLILLNLRIGRNGKPANSLDEEENQFTKFINQYRAVDYRIKSQGAESDKRFWYKAETVDFIGRKEQLEQLQAFCDNKDAISWWAVTGKGGSGKSRLAYQFILSHKGTEDWTMKFIAWEEFKKYDWPAGETFDYPKNLLIVVDYVNAYADKIGEWLQHLFLYAETRTTKIKVLLLERDGFTKEEKTDIVKKPQWYERLVGINQHNTDVITRMHKESPLHLPTLTEKDLAHVITSYVEKQKRAVPSESAMGELIKSLKQIDPTTQRPIYALFLADAWIREPDNFLKWDRNALLDWITSQESKKLELLLKKDRVAEGAAKHLLAFATTVGQIDIEEILEKTASCFEGLHNSINTLKSFEEQDDRPLSGILQDMGSEHSGIGQVLTKLVPDLMGEYYVLHYLKKGRSKKEIQEFVEAAWEYPTQYGEFLIRLINDYLDEPFVIEHMIKAPPQAENKSIEIFTTTLFYLAWQSPREAESTIAPLRQLAESAPDNKEILLEYAKGLVELSYHQELGDARATVDALRKLAESAPDNSEILVGYANGLVNLSVDQEPGDTRATVDALRRLAASAPDNRGILLGYAKGLFNLSNQQEPWDARITVDTLRRLAESAPDNQEILSVYAKGLVNLSIDQEPGDARTTVDALRQLAESAPDNQEILLRYANGLVNLSIDQEHVEVGATVDALRKLAGSTPNNPKILLEYAKGLVNLAYHQKSADAKATTVDALRQLADSAPDNREILLEYANGLVNLSNHQEDGATVDTLRQLAESTPDNLEILLSYARGLFNLFLKQNGQEVINTLITFNELAQSHPENQEVLTLYGKVVYTVWSRQSDQKNEGSIDLAKQALGIFEFILSENPGHPESEQFSECLVVLKKSLNKD